MNDSYPILEFDATIPAVTEPGLVLARRDVPDHCVICFFAEVIQKVVAEHHAKIIVPNN